MTFDPFTLIAIICIFLIIAVIIQTLVIRKILVHFDEVRGDLINKLMAKHFRDYTEGTHRIGMADAARAKAARKPAKEPKINLDEKPEELPDEVPVI